MTSDRRVYITGAGVISPIGRGCNDSVEALRTARSGVGPIRSFDSSGFLCQAVGEIGASLLAPDPHGTIDRFARLAVVAAEEALAQAGFPDSSIDPYRVGTLIGTGLGGCETLDSGYERLYARGSTRIPPMTIPRSMYNAATSAVSSFADARGPAFAVVSACASGTHAIGQAAQWIRTGLVDVVLAGGADAPIVPGIVRAWEGLRVLASVDGDPSTACRPFSAERTGLVLAEGAAVVVLESGESLRRRQALPIGEILGAGFTSDAAHVTDPSANGASQAINAALRDSSTEPEDIGYINAHGTATRANDVVETKAIREAFGSVADRIPVSSTKSAHGHSMGASGAIELVLSLCALNDGLIPATLNFGSPDPECDLDYVPNAPRLANVERFLSNSFGFGGMNATLIVATRHSTRL